MLIKIWDILYQQLHGICENHLSHAKFKIAISEVITAVLLGLSLLACDAVQLVSIYRRFEDRYASFFRFDGQEYSIILENLQTSDQYNKYMQSQILKVSNYLGDSGVDGSVMLRLT